MIGQQHGELVAAEPRERAGFRHARSQHVGELPQQQIAGAVAAGVVDDLELVEIHVQQRRRLAGLRLDGGEHRREPLLELAPIDEPRQRVVTREIREPAMQLPLLAHVVEHHHGADDLAVAVLDRRRGVLNRDRRAVARDEHDVVRERDDAPFLQAARDGVRDGFARRLVGQADDRLDRQPLSLARFPPRQLLGDGIQVLDVAARIGRHDRVADRLQRYLRAFLLVEQRALGGLALRDVRDRAFEIQRAAVGRRHEPRVLDDDDDAARTRAQLILEMAHPAVALELADEARALLRIHEELRHVAAAERGAILEAEHLHERRVGRQELAARRRLIDAVDDVVEQRPEARLAVAQRGLVLLAANRDARELSQAA